MKKWLGYTAALAAAGTAAYFAGRPLVRKYQNSR